MANIKSLSVVNVAYLVVSARKQPIHYKLITKLISKKCQLRGKTPHETVRSALARDDRFIRVAEGMYGLSEWEQYSAARFAKDIAYEILSGHGEPMPPSALGSAILKERHFVGHPAVIARNATKKDPRFWFDVKQGKIGLSAWRKKA
jgi:hypothetical protein